MLLPSILYGCEAKSLTKLQEEWSIPLNDTYLIRTALLSGFSGVDSAAMTANYAEKDAGIALTQSKLERSKVWVQSKFTPKLDHQSPQLVYNLTASVHDQVTMSFHWSLNALQVDHLDSYLLHCPSDGMYRHIIKKDFQIWQEFEHLRSEGLVNQIGVSNINLHSLKQLVEKTEIKPAIVQNIAMISNYVFANTEAQTLQYCLENAISYQVVQLLNRNGVFLNHKDAKNIAAAHNATTAQVLIKFTHLMGMTPVLGTTKEKHMQEALTLDFDLSNDEVYTITRLLPSSNLMFSNYLRLQSGDLLTQRTIVNSIIDSDSLNLDDSLSKVLKYIPKINPSILAYIAEVVDIETVRYLKENGARFDLLNGLECESIASTQSVEFMSIFKDELGIHPKPITTNVELTVDSVSNDDDHAFKVIMAAFQVTDTALSESIIEDIRSDTLSDYLVDGIKLLSMWDIREIISKHPEVATELLRAGASSDFVVSALSDLNDQKYFDHLMQNTEIDILGELGIFGSIINRCKKAQESDFYAGMALEVFKIESLFSLQEQGKAINKFISCCSAGTQTELTEILECYGKQNHVFDEL